MDFRNAKELLKVCQEQGLSISAVMLQRELTRGRTGSGRDRPQNGSCS